MQSRHAVDFEGRPISAGWRIDAYTVYPTLCGQKRIDLGGTKEAFRFLVRSGLTVPGDAMVLHSRLIRERGLSTSRSGRAADARLLDVPVGLGDRLRRLTLASGSLSCLVLRLPDSTGLRSGPGASSSRRRRSFWKSPIKAEGLALRAWAPRRMRGRYRLADGPRIRWAPPGAGGREAPRLHALARLRCRCALFLLGTRNSLK